MKSILLFLLAAASMSCHAQAIELTEGAFVKLMTCQLHESTTESDKNAWRKISDLANDAAKHAEDGSARLRGIVAGSYRIDELRIVGSFGALMTQSVLLNRDVADVTALLRLHGFHPKEESLTNFPTPVFRENGKDSGYIFITGKYDLFAQEAERDQSGQVAPAVTMMCSARSGGPQ